MELMENQILDKIDENKENKGVISSLIKELRNGAIIVSKLKKKLELKNDWKVKFLNYLLKNKYVIILF